MGRDRTDLGIDLVAERLDMNLGAFVILDVDME